jgi:molybdenum cofactor cytidylyltransferase
MAFAKTFAPALGQPQGSRSVVVGILLAAGRGRRFDPTGRRNKLLQLLPDQTPVVLQSLRTLSQSVDAVVAVVAPGAPQVQALLRNEGVPVVVCETADCGMAESLKAALQASLALVPGSATATGAHAEPITRHTLAGWVVALADMPFVQPETPRALAEALRGGARVAAPVFNDRRGNPVAFSRSCLPDLMALSGDTGARGLLGAPDVLRIAVSDPGVLRDIDAPGDLETR